MLDSSLVAPPYAFQHIPHLTLGSPSPGVPANMPGMGMPMFGYGVRPMNNMASFPPNAIAGANPMLGGADSTMTGTFGAFPPMFSPQFPNGMMPATLPGASVPNAINPSATMPVPQAPPPVVKGTLPPGKMKKQLGRPRKYPAVDANEGQSVPLASNDASRKRGPTPRPQLRSRLKPPKQSPSAWQIFFSEELQKIKEVSPEERLNVAHVAKDAGLRYAALPEWKRHEYQERSQEAKEHYEKELAAWRAKLTPDDIKQENLFRSAQRKLGKSRRGNLKDPNAPKKPLSAYFLFLRTIRMDPEKCKEVLEGEHETTKQSVLAAAKWRSMSDAEKQPYLEQADKDKTEYERLRREYEESHGIIRGGASATHALPSVSEPAATSDVLLGSDGGDLA
ncbi:hypothetical protein MOBT1_000956 [Malassezia obtusa]|uniref:HMG box domain-containing protein n=1 Tax=Malassezia obtusa TaxID=76774 RepID=A0AAF0DYF6_9BASI|nr:hypothetical protein MOBT1_000956 [Malassezia obtusa]